MVKPGYKQTEIGLIPRDWMVAPLGDVSHFHDNKRVPIKESDRIKMQGDYPYYGASGIIDYVNDYIFDGEYILLGEDGANIIDRSSRLAFVVSGKCWINNHAHVIEPHENMDIHFLSEYLESISYDEYNTGTAQPKLNREKCNTIPVPIPPLSEQIRIANLLRECDSLISTLEKEISKKKAIKQGAMQELLTGKKRLPGFCGEWKTYQLSEICQLINGRAYSQEELLTSGKYRVLRLGNLFTNGHWYYSDLELPEKQYCSKGDLIYAWSATFGPSIWDGEKVIYHYHIWKVELKETAHKEYVYHYLRADVNALMNELQGGTMAHLTKDTMEKRTIIMPENAEQKAIADVLTNMDAEIEALEQKLAKYRQVKQGMMQQLLTGKIRLV